MNIIVVIKCNYYVHMFTQQFNRVEYLLPSGSEGFISSLNWHEHLFTIMIYSNCSIKIWTRTKKLTNIYILYKQKQRHQEPQNL